MLRFGDLKQCRRYRLLFGGISQAAGVTAGGKGSSSGARTSMRVPMAAAVLPPMRAKLCLGPGFVTSTTPGGNSTGLTFFMSRARIRALARISSMRWCRKLAASVSGSFAVAM
jgi:hypothetical protein